VHQRELWVHPAVPATSLGVLVTSLGAPVTRLEAPRITLEQKTSSLGMLQVRLEWFRCAWNAAGAPGIRQVRREIVATTYCSIIVTTHLFRLYSHLCINVSMYLYSYPSTHGISALAAGGA